MEFTLKNYSCSSCNNDKTDLLLTKQGFSIVKCSNCGFVYVNPRIENEQLKAIYQHNYFRNKDYGYLSYSQEKRLRIKNFERWLNDANKYIVATRPVQALDIGCAAGYCMELMASKGWEVTGLELDDDMCIALKEKGFDVYSSLLQDYETGRKFSVITLFDVIEHIPEIDEVFRKLNLLLSDDGVVIIVTPDHDSFQRKLLGKRWFQYKPIEHIQYFNRKSLKEFAERNGLQIVHQTNCGQYADTLFLINRLSYYQFTFLAKLLNKLSGILRLKNRLFYTDTGSLFVILKRR